MSNTVIFTFGRFNPPTKGHERVVQAVTHVAEERQADHVVFLSQSHNMTTDPLTWEFKRRVCGIAFPTVRISDDASIKTPFQALESLSHKYKEAILVVGSDQVEEFATRISMYATQWGIKFNIVSAGKRNKENSISGISATKMRRYAAEGREDLFLQWLPKTLPKETMHEIWSLTVNNLKKAK